MDSLFDMNTSGTGPHARSGCMLEEALNLFVDGELPLDEQRPLFAHLADCTACARTLDGLLKFRRISRQEHLGVPPAVDEAFFQRLDRAKATHQHVDRAADRRPLWNARTPVSLRAAAVVAVLVFFAGLFVPRAEPVLRPLGTVIGEEERVEFVDVSAPPSREAVYVFYPGLTVEAQKSDEWSASTMLYFVPLALAE
jgi:hypothetical protein